MLTRRIIILFPFLAGFRPQQAQTARPYPRLPLCAGSRAVLRAARRARGSRPLAPQVSFSCTKICALNFPLSPQGPSVNMQPPGASHRYINGRWKFTVARNPESVPHDFWAPEFDDHEASVFSETSATCPALLCFCPGTATRLSGRHRLPEMPRAQKRVHVRRMTHDGLISSRSGATSRCQATWRLRDMPPPCTPTLSIRSRWSLLSCLATTQRGATGTGSTCLRDGRSRCVEMRM